MRRCSHGCIRRLVVGRSLLFPQTPPPGTLTPGSDAAPRVRVVRCEPWRAPPRSVPIRIKEEARSHLGAIHTGPRRRYIEGERADECFLASVLDHFGSPRSSTAFTLLIALSAKRCSAAWSSDSLRRSSSLRSRSSSSGRARSDATHSPSWKAEVIARLTSSAARCDMLPVTGSVPVPQNTAQSRLVSQRQILSGMGTDTARSAR
ncbi:hypothetical protein [Ralstonia phage RSK1]|uniref:Uncharacterized protein n=1 Tax=Ralstonia phage RSK1 TaxID=1417599 RepID=U6C864_9CAUD|nr:hypothetical protein X532_gp27 [Ralstonia phage RSK1]BAO04692.1 hypothetical protein [Ralstonia phage RSK1]